MTDHLTIHGARNADVPTVLAFIFEHGINPWNYLHRPSLVAHLADIETGKTQALLATLNDELAGVVTFMASTAMAQYQKEAHRGDAHGYISEAVVHGAHSGCGIGTSLLRAATSQLAAQGFREIYIERHEENLASAGMMRKTGFVEIDLYKDPARRATGFRRTSVSRLLV